MSNAEHHLTCNRRCWFHTENGRGNLWRHTPHRRWRYRPLRPSHSQQFQRCNQRTDLQQTAVQKTKLITIPSVNLSVSHNWKLETGRIGRRHDAQTQLNHAFHVLMTWHPRGITGRKTSISNWRTERLTPSANLCEILNFYWIIFRCQSTSLHEWTRCACALGRPPTQLMNERPMTHRDATGRVFYKPSIYYFFTLYK